MSKYGIVYLQNLFPTLALLELLPNEFIDALPLLAAWGEMLRLRLHGVVAWMLASSIRTPLPRASRQDHLLRSLPSWVRDIYSLFAPSLSFSNIEILISRTYPNLKNRIYHSDICLSRYLKKIMNKR